MSKAQFLKENLKPGEIYAGLVLGIDGKPDEHLFLLPDRTVDVTWDEAVEWAAYVGGRLPTLQEQSILFANCKMHLIKRWHWSCGIAPIEDASYAWFCGFSSGHQSYHHKSSEGAAVAVRSIPVTA